MKISEMLKREDFYSINKATLVSYFASKTDRLPTYLYIYPELNAIITRHPSKKVKEFIYTEYRIKAGLFKRLAVWLYTRILLNSAGLFAAKRIKIDSDAGSDTLIYPCNRKYRIFYFNRNTVDVTVKSGFPAECLKQEIEFRLNNKADFIPEISKHSETSYSENIIDGFPLARAGKDIDALKEKAWMLWQSYIEPTAVHIPAKEYADSLKTQINTLLAQKNVSKKDIDTLALSNITDKLCEFLSRCNDMVKLVLSHGDLQPGNIWIENNTNRIIIIDWESVEKRSSWYDEALLYYNLRMAGGLEIYLSKDLDLSHATVIFEELIFRLNELNGLPGQSGADNFNNIINNIGCKLRSYDV